MAAFNWGSTFPQSRIIEYLNSGGMGSYTLDIAGLSMEGKRNAMLQDRQ
jgi:hypothetical protein